MARRAKPYFLPELWMTMGGRRQAELRSRLGEESRDDGLEESEWEDMGLFWRLPATSSEWERQDMAKSDAFALSFMTAHQHANTHGAPQLTKVTNTEFQFCFCETKPMVTTAIGDEWSAFFSCAYNWNVVNTGCDTIPGLQFPLLRNMERINTTPLTMNRKTKGIHWCNLIPC